MNWCNLSILSLILTGCEAEIPWSFQTDPVPRVVVDGIITNELKSQCIILSYTNDNLNAEWQPVTGAGVIVDDGSTAFEFIESNTNPGYYFSIPFQAVIGKSYKLSIRHDTSFFEASSEPVSVTPLGEAELIQNKNLYRYIYSESGLPAMTEVYYDWSAQPYYCNVYGNCFAQQTFYTLDNVDVSELFSTEKQTIYFPAGTILLRKKYSLNEAHQEFIRSLLLETEWRGGIFDTQHGNAATNLSHGALGFFAVCMVVTDTLQVE